MADGVADCVHPCRQSHREDTPETVAVRNKIAGGGAELPVTASEKPQRADGPTAVADERSQGQPLPAEAGKPAHSDGQRVAGAGVDEVHDRHRHQARHHVSRTTEDCHPDADDHHGGKCRNDDLQVFHRQAGARCGQPEEHHEPPPSQGGRQPHDSDQHTPDDKRLTGSPPGPDEIPPADAPGHQGRRRHRRNRKQPRQKSQRVTNEPDRRQERRAFEEVSRQPFVGEADRDREHLLEKRRQHEHEHRPNRPRNRCDAAGPRPTCGRGFL